MRRCFTILSMILFSFSLLSGCTPTTTKTTEALEPPPPSYTDAKPLYDGLQFLADKLVTSIGVKETGTIAVADFVGPGSEIYAFGDHISNKVSVRMFSSGAFPDFMERKQLKQILQEKKKEHGYVFDQSTVKQFGKMLGLNSMAIGTIEDVGSVVDITVKIIASETGRLLGMADVQIIKDANIARMLREQRTSTLTVSITPPVAGTVVVNGKQSSLRNGIAVISGIPYGDHPIIIQPHGYDAIRKNVSIRSSAETFGYSIPKINNLFIAITVIPQNATLSVDGEKVALNEEGFIRLTSLEDREYTYVASAKGNNKEYGRLLPASQQNIIIELQGTDEHYTLKNKFAKKVQTLKQQSSGGVKLWTDKTTYQIGEEISFSFKTDEDCYLNLLDINDEGEITLLFPNKYHSSNQVTGGRLYNIPGDYGFSFQAQSPAGTDRIYAITSRSPLRLFSSDFNNESFVSVTRGNTRGIGVKEIGIKLDQALLDSAAEHVIRIY